MVEDRTVTRSITQELENRRHSAKQGRVTRAFKTLLNLDKETQTEIIRRNESLAADNYVLENQNKSLRSQAILTKEAAEKEAEASEKRGEKKKRELIQEGEQDKQRIIDEAKRESQAQNRLLQEKIALYSAECTRLEQAPGEGYEVANFLDDMIRSISAFDDDDLNTHVRITEIRPGSLRHVLTTSTGEESTFPIVINAMGLGRPTQLSNPSKMTTNATASQAGPRWQQELRPKDVRGKTLVFVGLGNSTAEMLRQLEELSERGYKSDFRVLTHYPKESVWNPKSTVYENGQYFRVFRDLSIPNLVDYQGDLPDNRYDYFKALNSGKIIAGVRRWEVKNNTIAAFNDRGRIIEQFHYDNIFTLTGYKHTAESLGSMGCRFDPKMECALFDYDGECIKNEHTSNPSRRLHKGYFGFGSVLETPLNPNAIVLPGMIYRIRDLLFGILMRATEYKLKLKYR